MKTISHYRQVTVNKKPKISIFALVIVFTFLAGVLVGATTDITQDIAKSGSAGLVILSAFYQGIVLRDVPRLAELVGNIAGFLPTATGPDSEVIVVGP